MLEFTVNGKIVKWNETSKAEAKFVKAFLSYDDPNKYYAPSYKKKWWDGIHKYYNEKSRTFHVGFLDDLLLELDLKGIKFRVLNRDYHDNKFIVFSEPFLSDDRDYQRHSISEWFRYRYGIIKVPTRGGKTFIAGEIVRLLRLKEPNCNILFITDGVDILNQNIDDICKVNHLDPKDIGIVQESKVELKPITVAMIQTIQSLTTEKKDKKGKIIPKKKDRKAQKLAFNKYCKKVTLLIVDEVQEYTSKFREKFILKFKDNPYFLAISATPWDDIDRHSQLKLTRMTGGIIYEIPENDLVDRGVLSDSLTVMFHVKVGMSYENGYQGKISDLIINNEYRNRILIEVLSILAELRIKTLVLFRSVKHGELIRDKTNYVFIQGDDNKKKRDETKAEFLLKQGGTLLASYIWKKGITLPQVEVTILADGGMSQGATVQMRGRALGATEDKKKSMHIDFVDDFDDEDTFLEHSISRLEAYEKQYEGRKHIRIIQDADLEKFKRIVNKWFQKN